MKRKPELEADLDPKGTRHERPGAKAAQTAVTGSKAAVARKRRGGPTTRPGATAAARAVEATRSGRRRGK